MAPERQGRAAAAHAVRPPARADVALRPGGEAAHLPDLLPRVPDRAGGGDAVLRAPLRAACRQWLGGGGGRAPAPPPPRAECRKWLGWGYRPPAAGSPLPTAHPPSGLTVKED